MNQPHLFRDEALKHYLESEEGRGLVRVSPPWTWALLGVLLAALGAGLLVSFLGRVEVNGRGKGIVRPSTGIRMLVSQSSGMVEGIEASSGQTVKAGAILLHIAAPGIQSQLLEAERQAESVRDEYQVISARQDAAYREQVDRLRSRIASCSEQIISHRQSIQITQRLLKAKRSLQKEGLISEIEVDETQEALAQNQRQLASARQALEQAHQERASLEGQRQEDLWQRRQVFQGAETKREAASIVQGQTVLQAPEDGVVEALLVKPGEIVQAGQTVGKLIPQGAPLQVVSFLEEKDRAFVKPGDEVHLELEQLPYAEYGTLRAKVVRVSDDLASPYEIREALGENQRLDTPAYRVELAITDATALTAAKVKLRSGMLMNVRYTLRRQRLITLVLDPLRRWFQ